MEVADAKPVGGNQRREGRVRAPRVFQTENGALEEASRWNLEEQTWDINDGAVGHLSSVRACPSPFEFNPRRVPI
jgi:hypothetical protein